MSQRPSFKSPLPSKAALRALPHSRPRTVAAARPANPSLDFRPYGCCDLQSFPSKQADDHTGGESKDMSSSPARCTGEKPQIQLSTGRFRGQIEGKGPFLAGNAGIQPQNRLFFKRKRPDLRMQDSEAGFEYTFQPTSGRNQADSVLKDLVHEHNQLKARVLRQEEVITELYGAQAPALRLLPRGNTAKPQSGSRTSAVSGRRSGSSLSGNQLRPPRPDSNPAFDDWRLISDRRPSFEAGIMRENDSQNLDSVGKSLFLYPSPEGVFGSNGEIRSERVLTGTKRYKSAPRPSRFPKEVFPMAIVSRHRPTLD